VVRVRTDILEESIASIIRVERISELGTTLAVTSNRSTLQRTFSSPTIATWLHIPEDGIFHSLHHEKLNSYRAASTVKINNSGAIVRLPNMSLLHGA
jgi:hypothetical protein